MATVKYEGRSTRGREIIVGDAAVLIDHGGTAEVPDDIAARLDGIDGFSIVKPTTKKKTTTADEAAPEEND